MKKHRKEFYAFLIGGLIAKIEIEYLLSGSDLRLKGFIERGMNGPARIPFLWASLVSAQEPLVGECFLDQ
jgi:hypothetical protein